MSLIAELREIIRESVKNGDAVSGIEIMGRFDWKWHAIPTLNEFRHAVRGIEKLSVSKDQNEILQFSIGEAPSTSAREITEADIQLVYDAYLKRIKSK